jgi:chain length determinant protein EpsF
MTLRQILTILKARRWLATAIFFTVVASAMGATLLFPKQYTASATVVVDVKSDPLATSIYAEEANSSYLGTQVEIATSERVATRVIKTLQFDEIPEYRRIWQEKTHGQGDYLRWLAHYVLKRVSVKSTPVSNVIDISVQWPSPALAAELANEFAQAYIDVNVALKVEMAKQYANRFEERAQKLRADLEAKQKALSDYENHTGIIATDDHLDVETARLNELSSQLVAIQSQRQESQSREHESRTGEGAVPEVLQNSLVTSLKSDLSKAEARQKDLETTLGVNHPAYKSAAAEVDSLRARLAEESSSIISSFGSANRVNQQREIAIKAALQEQRQRILELKHHHDEAAVLQNDVATAQRNLDAVSQRLAQSNLEGSTDQTNIGVLTPAAEPSTYSSPKYLLILAIALAGGAFLAITTAMGLELSDQRIRTDEEVLELLRVPVYGVIGRIQLPPPDRRGSVRALPQLGPAAG